MCFCFCKLSARQSKNRFRLYSNIPWRIFLNRAFENQNSYAFQTIFSLESLCDRRFGEARRPKWHRNRHLRKQVFSLVVLTIMLLVCPNVSTEYFSQGVGMDFCRLEWRVHVGRPRAGRVVLRHGQLFYFHEKTIVLYFCGAKCVTDCVCDSVSCFCGVNVKMLYGRFMNFGNQHVLWNSTMSSEK